VADTGELWAWEEGDFALCPLGHGEETNGPFPKPIESLRGIRVDAVVADDAHTLAVADEGSVYAWGSADTVWIGSLGLGAPVSDACARTPRRISRCVWLAVCDRMLDRGSMEARGVCK
jgi:alpha-tubulin suppressor-like RCC1 family protein